jgi:hypothetical protein
MSFHVRLQRQVLFTEETYNLSEPELRRQFVEPWLAGKPIIIKGRTWVPERSRIAILEGPDLTSTQRSWVQGWTKAIELSENVTDRFLHPPPIPVEKVRSAAPMTTKPENGAPQAEPEHREPGPDPTPAGDEKSTKAPESSAKPAGKPWYQTMFDVSTVRGAIATGLIVGLAVAVLAPLVTSLPSLPYKAGRSLYFAFAISAREKFDLENDVRHRPTWQRTPTLYGKSFSYAIGANGGNSDDGQLAETSGLAVAHHSISELAEKAVEFNGIPTEFVGKVQSDMTVSSEEDEGPLTTEYMLTGSKLGAVAFLGISYVKTGGISLSVGETVVVRGVVVASGVAREVGGSARSAVYIMGLSSEAALTGRAGAEGECDPLQKLVKEARESG